MIKFHPTAYVLIALALTAPDTVHAGLQATVLETGQLSLSVDGAGTNAASAIIQVEKPVGATVRTAHLSCAGIGASFVLEVQDGAVSLDGTPINWDLSVVNSSVGFFFSNTLADVTGLVTSKIDAAPAGRIDFTVAELIPAWVDGCLLAVIFNDPNQPATRTVGLFFGGQEPAGDTFQIQLAQPIDLFDPNLVLDFGLGVSFGAQDQSGFASHLCGTESAMFSTIDVNGIRVTSCAGNFDDGEGQVANGILLSVGGLDDTNDNPTDPFQEAADGANPRIEDDELYSLIPFVTNGSTVISVDTNNPSLDDNIFFAHLTVSGDAVIVVETIFSDGFESGNLQRWSSSVN